MQNFVMIEIVIAEIKIHEISVHANNEAAGGDAKAASIAELKPPPRQLQLYNSAAAAGAEQACR
jgi:hypothetical protein